VIDSSVLEDLISIVTRAVTDLAHIGSPADLAKILARQARDAKAAMPDDLRPVKPLLDDYRQALGLAFDVNDDKGGRFFLFIGAIDLLRPLCGVDFVGQGGWRRSSLRSR
jgi:hypothetical protein